MRKAEDVFVDYGSDYYFYIPTADNKGVQVKVTDVREVFEFGANKHKGKGFETGSVSCSKHLEAAMRHLNKFIADPTTMDEETGKSHLAHTICRLLMVKYQDEKGISID